MPSLMCTLCEPPFGREVGHTTRFDVKEPPSRYAAGFQGELGIDDSILALDNLRAHKSSIVTTAQILKLKFAMETAHSRYPDFQHGLTLAASISPDHALDWLVLTDKVRLLADQYGSWPLHPFPENLGNELSEQQRLDPACVATFEKYKRDMNLMEQTLKLRVLEVIEASIYWVQRQAS